MAETAPPTAPPAGPWGALLDSVTGKAKELAGALTGNDELVEEGQLRQAAASARRDANTSDALAEAQAGHATEELREDLAQTERQRQTAAVEADHRVRTAAQAAQAEKARIDAETAQREQAAQAEVRKQSAAELASKAEQAQRTRERADAHEHDAQSRHDQLLSEADAELERAAQLRHHAHVAGPADTDLKGSR